MNVRRPKLRPSAGKLYGRRRRRSGFQPGLTLVEIVAATVLAALLMVALTGVMQSMARQRRAVDGNASDTGWQSRLEERLRWDFLNARQMHVRPNQMTLVGYGGRDRHTGTVTHLPAEIVYFVRSIGGRPWLLRQERPLDARPDHGARVELLGTGVAGLHVTRLDEPDFRQPSAPGDSLYPVPSRLRCVLVDRRGTPVVDLAILQYRGGR